VILTALTPFLLHAMLAWVPASTPEDVARYEGIAVDIADVAAEFPVYPGPDGAERTAILMAATASMESRFERDVDELRKRGDGGRARGLLQVHRLGDEAPCFDRLSCLRVGRERIRESFRLAHHMPEDERLGPFVCGHAWRTPDGRARMARALETYRAWRRERLRGPCPA
jgi:hypothetical protein